MSLLSKKSIIRNDTKNTLLVKDYMVRDPLTLSVNTDILKAVSELLRYEISGAPVVDLDGKLVGVLTERDCIKVALNAGYFNDLGGKVAHYMSCEVETVSPDQNLIDIAERFIKSSYRRFPVIDNGALIGLISRRDILQALKDAI